MKTILQTVLLLIFSAASLWADDITTVYGRQNLNMTLALDWRSDNYGTIQWQSSQDGTTWTDIAGATATSYQFRPTADTWMRCVVNGDEACKPIVRTFKVKVTTFKVTLTEATSTTATFEITGLTIPTEEITEWGFCHNYNGLSRTYDNMYREKMGSTLPSATPLTLTCTGLEPNSTNSVRVYFKTRGGSIVYGPGKIVNTLPGLEWSSEDWQISKTAITARFRIAGDATANNVTFLFGPAGQQSSHNVKSLGNGLYEATVSGLTPATDYQATVTADIDGDKQTIAKTVRTWTDYSTYTVDNTVTPVSHKINWDRNNRIQLSPDNIQAEYARLVRVSADTILLTYHGGDGTAVNTDHWQDIYLQRSTDNGSTWSQPVKLMDHSRRYSNQSNGWYRFADPTFTRLANGWILMQFIGNANPETNNNCQVLVSISRDGGKTWGDPITVGRGRTWEPQIVQLPGGELELLVSSEAQWWGRQNNLFQEILCSRSTDNGLTWTAFTRASYNPGKRDGMPVPVVLQGNKGVLYSIESIGSNENPSLIHRDLDGEWDSSDWDGKYDDHRWKADLISGACAPYMLQLPTGEVVVMGHKNQSGSVWQTNREVVCLGDNTGHNFRFSRLPFYNMPKENGAYYGSLFLKDADTIWLAYTHSVYDGANCKKNTIEFIEGKIVEVK